ncbi:pentapeptide repeat-containing protein [Streptomyces sp. TRM S81-3]|uniref:Pentapeptide repeat-containing protein n=1 Tax=Streptomyces griseicoloratus TaxID=2752516 RepID=A0A926L0G1_9ACTN|nr:pentapeptide repeat-containing protein [Streptomyces griseicoloratus]MBD0419326.1 pentapeptide repeat-containing protein [Streptomyces griseicoloratus]
MSQPSPGPSLASRSWPRCGEDASPENPIGCPGIHVPGHTRCLAYLGDPERDAYLAGLTPGSDIDHRGTPFTGTLLGALLTRLRDPATGHPHLGDARFTSATFNGDAGFESAVFENGARFESATFKGDARFESATFESDARFESATFDRAVSVGPSVCAGRVRLSGAVFGGPVTLLFATRRLECRRTRWSSTAEVRLRYATVDFAHAVFEYPLTIAAEPDPFMVANGRQVAEDLVASAPGPEVRLASLRGVDAAHLVLSDVDLLECLFVGTVHLDQLRLEGVCTFDTVPPIVHWRSCSTFTRAFSSQPSPSSRGGPEPHLGTSG